MVGVATRYPRFDEGAQTLLNLEGRINACRTEHQKLPALAYESQELLALTSYVAEQSRSAQSRLSAMPRSVVGKDATRRSA
jgi:sulfur-oxidizing protein SoxA